MLHKFFILCTLWLINLLYTLPVWANDYISREDAFIFFASQYKSELPDSFQYIDILFKDVVPDSQLEDALQVLVYLDKIKNTPVNLSPKTPMNVHMFESFTKNIMGLNISKDISPSEKRSQLVDKNELTGIQEILTSQKREQAKISVTPQTQINVTSWSLWEKEDILIDVYNTLSQWHFDSDSFEKDQLIDGAIKWLADWTGDKFTTYFPPTESKDFLWSLEWEFEGIWAFVDMPNPGEVIIVTPIVDSPAEKSGVKWGDRVTHVDGVEIMSQNSLQEVVSWIKGPAGSIVELTIVREGKSNPFNISITRGKIVLKEVEHERINSSTYYIQIKNFWENVDTDFESALQALKQESGVRKIIFDLRNNPGWFLDEVSRLISHFIDQWLPTAIVDSGDNETVFRSLWYGTINLNNYEVIFLQNSWTASASEIMIGTLKDYFPEVTIIWEQSFWKGSVQSLKKYNDGSTLKYTSAKWFTGKLRNAIDGIGITPDEFLEIDTDLLQSSNKDNQLERAIEY